MKKILLAVLFTAVVLLVGSSLINNVTEDNTTQLADPVQVVDFSFLARHSTGIFFYLRISLH
ncbi:hypothetical protein S100141_04814 [Bacillus licheniformis]|uniref:hypothetical protein n=1 Tax=Bacillus licheniformis TaxID=1402 RepID=UPI000B55E711|nr:hypothetical protein [Bacillus licheniformis]ARW46034.1 hypothetical protein S100141_04814 [Bacillus licheniformis]